MQSWNSNQQVMCKANRFAVHSFNAAHALERKLPPFAHRRRRRLLALRSTMSLSKRLHALTEGRGGETRAGPHTVDVVYKARPGMAEAMKGAKEGNTACVWDWYIANCVLKFSTTRRPLPLMRVLRRAPPESV